MIEVREDVEVAEVSFPDDEMSGIRYMGVVQKGGRMDGFTTAIPLIEYTPKPGDKLTFWLKDHKGGYWTGVAFNDGPRINPPREWLFPDVDGEQ